MFGIVALLSCLLCAAATSISSVAVSVVEAPLKGSQELPHVVDGTSDGPQEVFVGLYILAITSVDQAKGQFGIDAYLFLRSPGGAYAGSCAEAKCTAQESISHVLVNGDALDVSSINKFVSDRNTTTQFRVKGTFSASFDYRDWPFESLQLQVAVEDPVRSNSSLQFKHLDGFTALSPTVTAPGWNLHAAGNATAVVSRVSVVEYRRDDAYAAFSRMTIYVFLSRPSLSSFLKYLLPPTMILVMQLFALVITPDSVATRVSMAGSGLVSAVLFHTQLTAQTPPANYLLFSDRFMLGVYFVIMLNGLGSTFVIKAKSKGFRVDSKRDALVWHAHWQCEAVALVGVAGAATAVVLAWFDAASLTLQVFVGGGPPLLALAVVSSAGAVLCHYVFGCHCVTPPEVLLEQAYADAHPSHPDGGSPSEAIHALSAPGKLRATAAAPESPPAPAAGLPAGPVASWPGAGSPDADGRARALLPAGVATSSGPGEVPGSLGGSAAAGHQAELDRAWEAAAGRALQLRCCDSVLWRAKSLQRARRSRRTGSRTWMALGADDDNGGPGAGILLTGDAVGGRFSANNDTRDASDDGDELID